MQHATVATENRLVDIVSGDSGANGRACRRQAGIVIDADAVRTGIGHVVPDALGLAADVQRDRFAVPMDEVDQALQVRLGKLPELARPDDRVGGHGIGQAGHAP